MSDPKQEGGKFGALGAYVMKNFPESGVSWSEGAPTIPGSQFQAHVMHSRSRIVKGRLWLTTQNGSTVEEAADNLLKLLKYREETGMQELKDYVKKEGYEEKGFIVEEEGFAKDGLYRVSVHLNIDFCKRTNRNRFVLGTSTRTSPGLSAQDVLSLLQFKKSKGYTWVDETTFKEALVKSECAAIASKLVKEQEELRKRGKDLPPAEAYKIKENELVPTVKWLGKKFRGPPDFFSGELPKLSEEIYKVLKDNGYLLDPVDERKVASTRAKEKAPPKVLVAYEAVEKYEEIRREKAKRKAEAEKNSKMSRISKQLGLKR